MCSKVRSVKVQFFSDLHVDVAIVKPIYVRDDVDLVVVAGDTCQGLQNAFAALRRIVPGHIPIVTIAGNHEFYRRSWTEEIAAGRSVAGRFGVTYLENDVALFADGALRVIGCTLWTDYRIFGDANATAAMNAARVGMNDHRVISWRKKPWARFRPEEALLQHETSKRFLRDTLSAPFAGKLTIAVTHHAPHFQSVREERYKSDLLTAAYVSDRTDLMTTADGRPVIDIWNHGHIHSSCDYVVNGTRILSNPHGYGGENAAFAPELVVELDL